MCSLFACFTFTFQPLHEDGKLHVVLTESKLRQYCEELAVQPVAEAPAVVERPEKTYIARVLVYVVGEPMGKLQEAHTWQLRYEAGQLIGAVDHDLQVSAACVSLLVLESPLTSFQTRSGKAIPGQELGVREGHLSPLRWKASKASVQHATLNFRKSRFPCSGLSGSPILTKFPWFVTHPNN